MTGVQTCALPICQMAILDRLEYPVSLGHDVFTNGNISFDSLRELSSVLSKFSSALQSYNIDKPKAISCTALREAKNQALVVDQLKVRNGLEVTVLEDSQEKAYIYKEVIQRLEGTPLQQGNTAIAYVGSGSIGMAVYDGQRVVYSQNIPMGALKLHDALHHLNRESEDLYYIVEEYLDTIFNRIAISKFQVRNLVLTGSQLELVAKLCEAKKAGFPYQISVKKLSALYQSIRNTTTENLSLIHISNAWLAAAPPEEGTWGPHGCCCHWDPRHMGRSRRRPSRLRRPLCTSSPPAWRIRSSHPG